MNEFFLVFTEGYDEPMQMVGPFRSYDDAVMGFWQSQIKAGAVSDGEVDPHQHYLESDAVRIGQVTTAPQTAASQS